MKKKQNIREKKTSGKNLNMRHNSLNHSLNWHEERHLCAQLGA